MNRMPAPPCVAITMGDPAGVGPEVVVKALAHRALFETVRPIVARIDAPLIPLAMMLGVRRSGVSIAASVLQKAGLIKYRRAVVTVASRPGLEEAACECYGTMRKELGKVFGPPPA